MSHVIDYVEFAVDDLEEAKAFYAKALGWTFNDYGPDYAGIRTPTRPGQEFGGLNRHPATHHAATASSRCPDRRCRRLAGERAGRRRQDHRGAE